MADYAMFGFVVMSMMMNRAQNNDRYQRKGGDESRYPKDGRILAIHITKNTTLDLKTQAIS
jgi:hypothetical protein